MKKLFTLIALAAMAFAAQADVLTVAEGTGEAVFAPFYGFQMDAIGSISQVIYPADMLADMNGGTITEVKFYPTQAFGDLGSGNLQISLKEVEQDRYTSTTLVTDATVVANAYPIQGNAEWVIVFDQPFEYHGGNLMIETELIQVGSYKDTKFFGQSFSYAVGIAQYKYSWGTDYYYETEQVLPKTTFTYEGGGEEPGDGVTTLGQANALEDNAAFTFNGDAVVTICWKGSVYLRDETGYGQIVDSLATFENGQVLSQGWTATKTSNNGWVKFIDAANLSASGETNAELAAPQKLTSFPEASMLNAYVWVENVHKGFVPIRTITLPDGLNIDLTGTGNQPATGDYNIYGLIWKSGDKLVFEPVDWVKYVEPQPEGLRGDVNGDKVVDIKDATDLINYLLTEDPTGIIMDNANCNLLDEVDIADATALINYLLNSAWGN